MDPRSGAILAVANWPQVNANDPAAAPPGALQDRAVGFDYEPGSTFKAVTVSGALQQGLITPDTGFNVPDQIQVADRTIHDDTEHGEETLTTSQILARSSNVGAIKIGMLEGARALQQVGAPLRLRGTDRRRPPERGSGPGAAAQPLLGLLDGQPADRPGRARHADADGDRLRGDRQRRHPAPARTRRRGRRQGAAAARRAPHHLDRHRASLRHMLEGVLAPGGTASEVSIPGYQLAGKTGTASARSTRSPTNTRKAPTWPRSSASRRPPTRSC